MSDRLCQSGGVDDLSAGDLGEGLGRKPGSLSQPWDGKWPPNNRHRRTTNSNGLLQMSQEDLQNRFEESRGVIEELRWRLAAAKQKEDDSAVVLQVFQQQEVNGLRWAVDSGMEKMEEAGKSWLDRYDSLCAENAALMASLKHQSAERCKLSLENTYLHRQCDELLSNLNLCDRHAFLHQAPTCEALPQADLSSVEMMVLGACHCQSGQKQPCSCAWAAAHARRDLASVRQQVSEAEDRAEETAAVAEAFRAAFEQQLRRAAGLTAQLARVPNKSATPVPHRLRQKLQKLLSANSKRQEAVPADGVSEIEGQAQAAMGPGGLEELARRLSLAAAGQCDARTLDGDSKVLDVMTELLNDQAEVLSHQRRISLILARRVSKLERCLRRVKHIAPDMVTMAADDWEVTGTAGEIMLGETTAHNEVIDGKENDFTEVGSKSEEVSSKAMKNTLMGLIDTETVKDLLSKEMWFDAKEELNFEVLINDKETNNGQGANSKDDDNAAIVPLTMENEKGAESIGVLKANGNGIEESEEGTEKELGTIKSEVNFALADAETNIINETPDGFTFGLKSSTDTPVDSRKASDMVNIDLSDDDHVLDGQNNTVIIQTTLDGDRFLITNTSVVDTSLSSGAGIVHTSYSSVSPTNFITRVFNRNKKNS
uniref:coiled-coil domain-containing protein 125 isoform X2 n=1 Tax=Myxine glutinosa TaxID=7769 RepID=UPI00358F3D74